VAHGIALASLVSRMVGMQLPGAGALWMRQSFQWPAPVFAGDNVEITLRVTHKSAGVQHDHDRGESREPGMAKTVMSVEGAVLLLEQQKPARPALVEREWLVAAAAKCVARSALRRGRTGRGAVKRVWLCSAAAREMPR